jgi:hypothetical protein
MKGWITATALIKYTEVDLKALGLVNREDITTVEHYTAMMERDGFKLDTCEPAVSSQPFSTDVSGYELHFTQL